MALDEAGVARAVGGEALFFSGEQLFFAAEGGEAGLEDLVAGDVLGGG